MLYVKSKIYFRPYNWNKKIALINLSAHNSTFKKMTALYCLF